MLFCQHIISDEISKVRRHLDIPQFLHCFLHRQFVSLHRVRYIALRPLVSRERLVRLGWDLRLDPSIPEAIKLFHIPRKMHVDLDREIYHELPQLFVCSSRMRTL